MKWQDKITKKELKHLRDCGMKTLKQAKETFAYQKALRDKFPKSEPCWDCKCIARKLGFDV